MSTEHPENTNLVSKEGEDNDDSTLGVIYPRPKAIFSSLRALHNAAHHTERVVSTAYILSNIQKIFHFTDIMNVTLYTVHTFQILLHFPVY